MVMFVAAFNAPAGNTSVILPSAVVKVPPSVPIIFCSACPMGVPTGVFSASVGISGTGLGLGLGGLGPGLSALLHAAAKNVIANSNVHMKFVRLLIKPAIG